ncbi:unnamed protein product [Closterium sp. Naga37s-1]|nr:unnamed protein product [Closterium sp. Naga37s-1]CAI5499791.1 unnamed protein product [Closterium sp. Naga37s-1]
MMAREARALSDPVGCLKKFDVVVEAGGATVVLAAEDKSVLADDSADFTAAVLDFACMSDIDEPLCSIIVFFKPNDLQNEGSEGCATRLIHIDPGVGPDGHAAKVEEIVA